MLQSSDNRMRIFKNTAYIAMAGTFLSLIGLTLAARRSGAWQLWLAVADTLILFLLTNFSLFLAREGHLTRAAWLLFLSGELAFLGGGALVANLGWMLGLSILALISSMSTLLLPAPQRPWATLTAFTTAALLIALDVFAPGWRLSLSSALQTYLLILFAVIALGYLFYYAQLNRTLRARLTSILLALTLAPLGIAAFTGLRTLENRLRENLTFQLQAAAKLSAARVDEFIRADLETVRTQAQLPEIAELLKTTPADPEWSSVFTEAQATLDALSRRDRVNILSYGLLNQQGINIADSITTNIGDDESHQEYFITPLREGLPYVSPVNARANTLIFAAPVRDERGNILGVLRLIYNATVLQQLMVSSRELAGPTSFAMLIDENGIVLGHGDNSAAIFKTLVPLDASRLAAMQSVGRLPEGSAEALSLNLNALAQALQNPSPEIMTAELHPSPQHREVFIVQSLSTRPWKLLYGQQESFLLLPLRRQFLTVSILAIVIGILAAFAALRLSDMLLNPILRLTEAARQVQAGNLQVEAPVLSEDETGLLAQAFNTMTVRLRELIGSLEQRVAERTRELEERSLILQRTAEIASVISSTLDPQQLTREAVELIRERFGLYYVGLFELDGSGEWAVLRAGTGEAGQKMLARGHRIRIGTGMIGWSIAHNQARIAQQAELDEVRLRTPELPETRSEAAIPLRSRGQVIGALTIQSERPNAFTPDNLTLFQILTDQLATALDNAYLFAESQETLRSLERLYAERTRTEWRQALLRARRPIAFRSSGRGSLPAAPLQTADVQQALQSGQPIVEVDTQTPGGNYLLAVPIKIRGHVIGVLRTYKPAERGQWSEDEISTLQIVADQIGAALEAARLYGDTQRRAERERLLAEITAKVRSVTDPQEMARIAMEELRQALAVKEVKIVAPGLTDGTAEQAPSESS